MLETVSTKQARIANLAKRLREKPLLTLAHLMDLDWLEEAHRRTRKDGATGIDGQTAAAFEEKLGENLRSLLDRAKSGHYRAPPVRRVHIPKGDGSKTRPIGIPTYEDKVLQRATMMLLEPVYEKEFYDFSYGFRPQRSAHDALNALDRGLFEMCGGWVLDVDIKSFFDTLDHAKLRDLLRQRVADGVVTKLIGKGGYRIKTGSAGFALLVGLGPCFPAGARRLPAGERRGDPPQNAIPAGFLGPPADASVGVGARQGRFLLRPDTPIGKWLRAGVLEGGVVHHVEQGTPQGGVISPLLANIYLHEVLDRWWVEMVLPCMHGRAFMVRYADDFVMVFSTKEDAERVLAVLPKRFARFGLTLHPEKTRMVRFLPPNTRGDEPESFDFLGFTHYMGRTRRGRWSPLRKTSRKRLTRVLKGLRDWMRDNRHMPVPAQAAAIEKRLRGHFNYFGIRGNSRALNRLSQAVRRLWHKWLSRRSQRGRLSWDAFNRLLERYPLPRPRLRPGWDQLQLVKP